MHRSSSSAQVSGDFAGHSSPPTESYKASSDENTVQLPTYNPQSYIAKKEQYRIRSAESAVHIIPILLVICAFILWFFSDSGSNEGSQQVEALYQ